MNAIGFRHGSAQRVTHAAQAWVAGLLRAALLVCSLHGAAAMAQSATSALTSTATATASPAAQPGPVSAAEWRARQGAYYKRNWGVEIVGVKPVSSGTMLAFRYRVLDPEKAKLLNDRQSKAYLRDEASGTVLAVPAMENVGELRNGSKPEADRSYFMVFGNPGKLVKSGSRVTIVAGALHVDGLIVD
jgi:hypothetical protein